MAGILLGIALPGAVRHVQGETQKATGLSVRQVFNPRFAGAVLAGSRELLMTAITHRGHAAPVEAKPEAPWDRARRVARELAEILEEIGGRHRAIVLPVTQARYPVLFEVIDL